MNCYLCLIETRCDQPAHGLCQHCGAGMCGQHLQELRIQPLVGLAGTLYPTVKYSLICQRCYLAMTTSAQPTQRPQKQKKAPQGSRWKRFWQRPVSVSTLPTEEDAVAIVERFLKQL
jgi:hypothetical protein